ncbi:MAG TPA: hypothetical protein VFV43_10545 [Limnobacter sp.]|nr:hypothetical protein [Limnobacter sp.]
METINGVDMEEAMQRVMGNRALIFRVLQGVVLEYDTHSFRARLDIERGAFEEVRAFFHSIKGLAANVAASETFICCANGEQACIAKDSERALDALDSLAICISPFRKFN